MAERRMFAKTIIDSDAFLDMPLSAQALYFHLSMRADDDGFINNPKKIQRMIGSSDDDLKLLVLKRFIIPFESGIVVIKHWKIHNYIRGDRKKDTVYPEEMSLLCEKENGAYSLKSEEPILIEEKPEETARQKAYRESSLPYSFDYKIRHAFYGETCPVCGFKMQPSVDECGIGSDIRKPTIQHNIPVSKGGKHELGNISVICHQCNVSLQNTETGDLNADEVIRKWEEICSSGKCQSSDSQVTVKRQHRLGQDSAGEGSTGEVNESSRKRETTHAMYLRLLPDFIIHDRVHEKMEEWLKYKTERKDKYTETGLKALLRRVENTSLTYGDDAVIELIEESIANGWKGIMFDRLKQQKQATSDRNKRSSGGIDFRQLWDEERGYGR